MARPSKAAARYRAQIGGYGKHNCPSDDPRLRDTKRALAVQILAERVERVMRDFGPLTDAQRERIAALLRVG